MVRNIYIRSQDGSRLYSFGTAYSCLKYSEQLGDYDEKKNRLKKRHTIQIIGQNAEEIAEYESEERCMEILNEVQQVCGGQAQKGSLLLGVYDMPVI